MIGDNAAGAFASPLRLVLAGSRYRSGDLEDEYSVGRYWSSTVSADDYDTFLPLYRADYFTFTSALRGMSRTWRTHGFSVRCIKE